jgi:magnesium transporter
MLKKLEITSKFLKQVTTLIKSREQAAIIKIFLEIHPADIAEIIENLNDDEGQYIFEILESQKSADTIIELEDEIRDNFLSELSPKEIAEDLIEKLESDDAVDIISDLSEDKKNKVLTYIEDKSQYNNITDLLSYDTNTAGGLMAKELIKVNENWSTVECLAEMRKQAKRIKKVHTIYIIDNNNILLGLLSLRNLLVSEKSTPIKSIIKKDIISVKSYEKKEVVANIMNKYDLVVLPVVDKNNKLLGRITIDDVIDYVKEDAEKDYQMASGISEDIESNDNIFELTRARLPWLIIGMAGGILGAKIIGIFDLENNFELAFFIPLIAAMGGNVGVQSAAIVVQGLANNNLQSNNISNKLIREFGVGLLNGIICSIIILFVTIILGFSFALSITVSISLLSVIIFAAIFGTFIPLILNKNNIDPALATGPFITTVNDILGLIIYFSIGQAIL